MDFTRQIEMPSPSETESANKSPSETSSNEDLTTLSHLPELCLEGILKFLNLNDLIQANICTGLSASAIRIFNRNFKDAEIEFVAKSKYPAVPFRNVFNSTNICDEVTFPLILNQFGSILTKLKISTEIEMISQKMTEICHSNLSELTITLGSGDLQLEHTFENLQKLTLSIAGPNMDDSWMQIDDKYPKLKTLQIVNQLREEFQLSTVLMGQTTKLKHFGLHNICYPAGTASATTELTVISNFLNRNRQLSLALEGYSRNLEIIQQNTEWKTIKIEHLSISTLGLLPNLMHVQQLKKLRSLKLCGLYHDRFEVFNISKLEELDIDAKCQNKSFLNFLIKFKCLKKIKIGSCSSLILKNIVRLGCHFDELMDFTIYMHWKRFDTWESFVLDGITELMNCRSDLKSVNVSLEYDYPQSPAKINHRHWMQHKQMMKFKQIENKNWRMIIDCKDEQLSYFMNISFQNQPLSICTM